MTDEIETTRKTSRIQFNAFDMSCIMHQSPGLWSHPQDQSTRYKDLDYWVELAKLLEKGKFDGLFIADVLGVYDTYQGSADASIRRAMQIPVHNPLLQVTAMAAATTKLGFGITVSSTYEQPYSLARTFGTLDHLTKGRIAWNIVTSYLDGAARNLGMQRQMTGVRCGEGSERYTPGTEKYFPWCPISCTLAGSA
jgi:alkanesulfonate monooxygenase SsuD/methylene tetrahydromethanopterin reductase-like flavin-dependent oxidoreductase (luciferase family)